ncbi:MAG: phosphotransferase [Bacilli bacterium]|nr:phosphotransferase [Bacilli bacterium]
MKNNEFEYLENIIKQFKIEGIVKSISRPNSDGNINNTYVVTCDTLDGNEKKYILQEINQNVFENPYKVMENIENVTAHIEKINPNQEILRPIKRNFSKQSPLPNNIYTDRKNKCWRMYNFIDNSISYDVSKNPEILKQAGIGFAKFHKDLAAYPMNYLYETIPNFHNTQKRFLDFLSATRNNPVGRVQNCHNEIVDLLKYREDYPLITDLIEDERIPLRVVHNDTKINNILFDKDTQDFKCVIDLDTIMPGSVLYDIADAIRSGAATSFENETDLSKVTIDMNLVEAFLEGYLSIMKYELTYEEIKNIPNAIKIITLELAMRFLTDYINGDVYFKTDFNNPKLNLERAQNQIKLAKEIEAKIPEIHQIIDRIVYTKDFSRTLKKPEN